MKTNFLLILVSIFSLIASAQKNIHVSIAGKKYIVPEFKQDSVQSFRNKFVEDGIIPSITDSKAIIEIRYFGENLFRGCLGDMFIIQYFSDSVVARKIVYMYALYKSDSDYIYKYNIEDSVWFYINIERSTIFSKRGADSTLNELINNKAFSLRDHHSILKDLVSQNDSIVDPYKVRHLKYRIPDDILEIKLKNHYRNIKINHMYARANSSYPEFNSERNIADLFFLWFNNVKVPDK